MSRHRLLPLALILLPGLALADRPPLGQVEPITEGLITAAIVYEIGRVCEPVHSRRVQGIGYLLSLQAKARSLGYSREEIDAFVEDEAEKARLEAIARARLRAMGAIEGQPDTFCAVGRAEMARGSQIGALLYE